MFTNTTEAEIIFRIMWRKIPHWITLWPMNNIIYAFESSKSKIYEGRNVLIYQILCLVLKSRQTIVPIWAVQRKLSMIGYNHPNRTEYLNKYITNIYFLFSFDYQCKKLFLNLKIIASCLLEFAVATQYKPCIKPLYKIMYGKKSIIKRYNYFLEKFVWLNFLFYEVCPFEFRKNYFLLYMNS